MQKLSSAFFLIESIAYFLFEDAKTLFPATKQFAPKAEAFPAVSWLIPPSTWISISGRASLIYFILGRVYSINFCPPKPGYTVMTNSLSISPYLANSIKLLVTKVLGLMLTPADIFFDFILVNNYLISE